MATPDQRSPNSSLVPAVLATVSFSMLAGTLVIVFGAEYGVTLFVVAPFLTGCVAAFGTSTVRASLLVLVGCQTMCCLGLLIFGLEALVCLFMAAPLMFVAGLFGIFLAQMIKPMARAAGAKFKSTSTVLLAASLIACSAIAEHDYLQQGPYETVVTTRVFPEPINRVWEELLEFREIEGEKPILLKLGLPVPLRCVMEGLGVGADRICYFDHGTIEQKVTVWKPPLKLELEITRVNLLGKDWLRFASAAYELEVQPGGTTQVHRTTRYLSDLRPRVYWRPLERLAIHSEHEFVFNALESKIGDARLSHER